MKFIKKHLPTIFGLYYNTLATIAPQLAARQAFGTFTRVRRGRYDETQREYLQDAMKERLQVNGQEIQLYEWDGEGEQVLLVHGWESNTYRWRFLIPKLREAGFAILAFDAPGHGASEGSHLHVLKYADCMDEVMKRYKPKFVVGHSVGGMTTLYGHYRSNYSQLEKIVTLGSPAEFKDIVDHYQDLLALKPGLMSAFKSFINGRYGVEVDGFSSPEFVKENQIQGLLFHDREDPITPFRASETVHSNWKKSRLVATQGLGHSLQEDSVHQQIVSFLQEGL